MNFALKKTFTYYIIVAFELKENYRKAAYSIYQLFGYPGNPLQTSHTNFSYIISRPPTTHSIDIMSFTFTQLSENDEQTATYQSLLSFGPLNILVDVGWDCDLSSSLDHIIRIAPNINAILLTHATISHLGAYAYLCKAAPEFATIPVYATLPIINMGRIITLDSYRSKGLLGPLVGSTITLTDVETCFDKIEPLKYSQPFSLSGMLNGVTITAYNAGHTVGGTIWRIQKDQENVVYAVDWNHSRDTFLNGSALLQNGKVIESLTRPTVFICGTKFGQQNGTLSQRKTQLHKRIEETISRGGTILIPTSSGARVLELVLILENLWEQNGFAAPLYYYSHVGSRTMSYASSMLEWMSGAVIDEWQKKNNSPFQTRFMKVTTNIADLYATDGPKVILASSEAMETGFSKELFTKLCTDDANMVILTEYCNPQSLAGKLHDHWTSTQTGENDAIQIASEMHISFPEEEVLEGAELTSYNASVKEERLKQEMQEALEMRNRNLLEQEDNEVFDAQESESDDDFEFTGQPDTNILLYGKDVYDFDVRRHRGKSRMFPYAPKRQKVDDYGEVIKADDFLKNNETLEDLAGKKGKKSDQDGGESAKIGEKKMWGTESKFGKETAKLDIMSQEATPKKLVTISEDVKVLCYVDYIDFAGLADERSIKEIVPSVQPRKLIVLPSDIKNSANVLKDDLEGTVDTIIVSVPNKAINASINTFAFEVKVSPELDALLKWQKIVSDYSVAHVTGKLVVSRQNTKELENGESMHVDTEDVNQSQSMELIPLRTAQELAAAPRSNPLLVGDIKLTELKRKLVSLGHRAEFRAEGVLVCDDKVAVRKLAEGRLVIEGGIGGEFYEIKKVVRSYLAVV